MEYLDHKIKPKGFIELREVIEQKDENGDVIKRTFHRSVILPNELISVKYKEQIEADENFTKYRTKENADTYEAKVNKEKISETELVGMEKKRQEKEDRQKALDSLIKKEIKEMKKK